MSNVDHDHGPDCGDPRSVNFPDKCLSVWIFDAMAIGVAPGYAALYFQRKFDCQGFDTGSPDASSAEIETRTVDD